jgi:hypothetical protein
MQQTFCSVCTLPWGLKSGPEMGAGVVDTPYLIPELFLKPISSV